MVFRALACTAIVPHNGFPVLYPNGPDGLPPRGGNLAGIIYRKHLCVLLKHGTDDKTLFRPAPSHDEAQRISTAASLGMKLIRRGSRRGGMLVSATELGPQSRHSTRILEWHALEGIFPRYPAVQDIVLTEQQRYGPATDCRRERVRVTNVCVRHQAMLHRPTPLHSCFAIHRFCSHARQPNVSAV